MAAVPLVSLPLDIRAEKQAREEKLKETHARYLQSHPEVELLLQDFISAALVEQPVDVFDFARGFFSLLPPGSDLGAPFAGAFDGTRSLGSGGSISDRAARLEEANEVAHVSAASLVAQVQHLFAAIDGGGAGVVLLDDLTATLQDDQHVRDMVHAIGADPLQLAERLIDEAGDDVSARLFEHVVLSLLGVGEGGGVASAAEAEEADPQVTARSSGQEGEEAEAEAVEPEAVEPEPEPVEPEPEPVEPEPEPEPVEPEPELVEPEPEPEPEPVKPEPEPVEPEPVEPEPEPEPEPVEAEPVEAEAKVGEAEAEATVEGGVEADAEVAPEAEAVEEQAVPGTDAEPEEATGQEAEPTPEDEKSAVEEPEADASGAAGEGEGEAEAPLEEPEGSAEEAQGDDSSAQGPADEQAEETAEAAVDAEAGS